MKAQVKKTLGDDFSEDTEDRMRRMILAFDKVGVSQDQIERRIGHSVTAIVPDEFADLQAAYNTVKSDHKARADLFPPKVADVGPTERIEARAPPASTAEQAVASWMDRIAGTSKRDDLPALAEVLSVAMQDFNEADRRKLEAAYTNRSQQLGPKPARRVGF